MDIQSMIYEAKNGNLDACNQVGDHFYELELFEDALAYYLIAAKSDNPPALYKLANYYLCDAATKDYILGIQYMRRAAELNHPRACRQMGFCYFWGRMGLSKDIDESFFWFKKGADLGDKDAQSHIAQCYQDGIWGAEEKNYTKARQYYDKALAQNNAHAQWCVGMNYKYGDCGYPQDYEKAAYYLHLSAENGSDKGQLDFAICCYNGQGVPTDLKKALEYMEKAANQGNDDALYRCGMTYFFADATDVTDANLTKGRKYLQMAAEKGNIDAKKQLQEIAEMERIHGTITAAKIKGSSSSSSSSSSSGGCYVATAVYGSYDCPQVWTLRRFRDNYLLPTWYGKAFVHCYYAVSPTLVRWFGNCGWFQNFWRGKLDRLVHSLQANGVENTPYNDKM